VFIYLNNNGLCILAVGTEFFSIIYTNFAIQQEETTD
jgi:hypothetical protein